jgi:hypothetical protein
VIFWAGVGLAPVAAALVLLSSSAGGLRMAAVLGILTVILIGLSIMLRPDARTVRVELEDLLLDEIDAVREDVRQDIATAVRAAHRAYAEKLQGLYSTVEALRAQVEALRAGPARGEPYEPAGVKAPAPPQPSVGTAMVAGGVVRHTETVQVTTRQTIVDADGDRGTVYGGGTGTVYGGRPAEPPGPPREAPRREPPPPEAPRREAPPRREALPREESWTEQRLRERLAEVRATEPPRDDFRREEFRRDDFHREDFRREEYHRDDQRSDEFPAAEPRRPRPYERDDVRPTEPAEDPGWTGLRMGTRRAAVRSDDTGTELRIEDRWAELRRGDDGRRADPRWERREGREEPGTWSDPAWGRASPAPALPASGPEPASAWTGGWRDEPEREREPRRRRAEGNRAEGNRAEGNRAEDPRDERWGEPAPVNPRPRRPDYEMSDDRWR